MENYRRPLANGTPRALTRALPAEAFQSAKPRSWEAIEGLVPIRKSAKLIRFAYDQTSEFKEFEFVPKSPPAQNNYWQRSAIFLTPRPAPLPAIRASSLRHSWARTYRADSSPARIPARFAKFEISRAFF